MASDAEVMAAAEELLGFIVAHGVFSNTQDTGRFVGIQQRLKEAIDAQRRREEERASPVTREALIGLGFLPDDSGDDSLYRKIWQPHEPEDNRNWDGDMCHLFVERDMSFGFESYTKDGVSLSIVAVGQLKTVGQLGDFLSGLGIEAEGGECTPGRGDLNSRQRTK